MRNLKLNRLGIAALLMVAFDPTKVMADAADAVNYNINFTLVSGTPLPSAGSFTYDPDTPNFTNFVVRWYGLQFDLTSEANNPGIWGITPCLSGATGAAATFALLSGSCPDGSNTWIGSVEPSGIIATFSFGSLFYSFGPLPEIYAEFPEIYSQSAEGAWTITPASAPEPSAYVVMLTGLGLIGLVRKQIIPANRKKS